VAGGKTAAQVVIVECGQVVVNQRVGVQHLQRGAQLLDAGRNTTLDHLPGLNAENGPQALATGKHAVPHGLMNAGGILRRSREQALQYLVGDDSTLLQSVLEHEEGSINDGATLCRREGRLESA
jgi:hypothetical protein